jgi:hypothetical protein
VITVFSPRDHEGLHKFYSNSLSEGVNQNVHLRLGMDGLKPAQNLLIDPYFPKDFVVNTDVWKLPRKEDPDYLVKIELPLPEKITYMSPLHPVTLENRTSSFQSTNFVLEYKVTDAGRIHAASPDATSHKSNNVSPLTSSALQMKYNVLCEKPEKHYYESCANLRNLLEQGASAKTMVFFFGVGIPPEDPHTNSIEYMEAHAVDFFNKLIPQSFPNWPGPRLAPKGQYSPQGPSGSTPMLMKTSFRPTATYPPVRPVPVNAFFTAVIDCKAGNVIVTAQTTQQ